MDTVKHMFHHGPGQTLVTASQGVVGNRVARRLLKEGGCKEVRVGCRDPLDSQHDDAAQGSEVEVLCKLEEAGATKVHFCWEREETYHDALKGIRTVFCSTPGYEGWEERFPKFLKACKHAGVRNVVKLSFYHALTSENQAMTDFAHAGKITDAFKIVPLVQMHGECDKYLMKSGLNYTMLFPTHLMSNPLRYQGTTLRNERKFYGASGFKGVNYVSPNDVADVAVQAILHHGKHHRKGYTLTGPTAIKDQAVAEHLSKAFDTQIEYVEQAAKKFENTDVAALELIKASGVEESTSFVSHDIKKVLGREAQTYEEYLDDKDSMTVREKAAFLPPETAETIAPEEAESSA